MEPTAMTGAQMVIRALEDEGVSTIFGIPGGTVLSIYDALYDAEKLNHILVRHEQAAAHAADGYARASGRVGVCCATSGPGATNLITGIATANLDSSPIVAITGQVSSSVIGTDAFQEADIFGTSFPLVKHSFQLRDVSQIQPVVHKAFHIASTGRPGPVLIDVPADVQKASGEYRFSKELDMAGYRPGKMFDVSRMDEAADLIAHAARPVILAGGGCVSASRVLTEFAASHNIPVATTLMGKGVFPESHALSLGMAGMHGAPAANRAIMNADVLIAVGTRFSDRTTGDRARFAHDARIIHIDIDAAEIDKSITADVWLSGDAGKTLKALSGCGASDHQRWLDYLNRVRAKEPIPRPDYGDEIAPHQIFDALNESDDDFVITTEVGENQMWAAQFLRIDRPRRFITSGGLGTMGFGLPAAVGAAFAGYKAAAIAGDGSLMMNIQELDTCARYSLPVKVILLNNGCLGNVRMLQDVFCNRRYSNTIYNKNPDFVKIAEAMGIEGSRIAHPCEIRDAVKRLLNAPGPALLDVRIPQGINILPMVRPGDSLNNMIM